MDLRIREILLSFGYEFDNLGNFKQRKPLPSGELPPKRLTYYTLHKETGEVVTMPNLPADPYSMRNYLEKGFTLSDPRKATVTEGEKTEYVCEICNAPFPTQQALAGHYNRHRK